MSGETCAGIAIPGSAEKVKQCVGCAKHKAWDHRSPAPAPDVEVAVWLGQIQFICHSYPVKDIDWPEVARA